MVFKRSDEQKQDLKLKITVGVIVLVVVVLVGGLGPGLPRVLEQTRQRKTEPWAPERYYQIARIMQCTFREDQAQEVYVEFYHLYRGDEDDQDFSAVTDGDDTYYLPWEVAKFDSDPDKRPKPVSSTRHELLGWVLYQIGRNLEDNKKYTQSDHVWRCLKNMWPEGSEIQQLGAEGDRRRLLRSL